MSRRTRWTVVVTALALAAFAVPAAAAAGSTPTYEVTIQNLTAGQPITPPLLATHRRPADLFEVGQPASFGIKEIAENGNLGPMLESLEANKHISEIVVAIAGDPPPLMPGAAITVDIEGGPGAKWLSYASMLICTNDGFTGVDGLRLPKTVGDSVSVTSFGYDAGTEQNSEQLADIVPPCQGLTGVGTGMVDGTNVSNTDLAEGGVITHHGGVVTVDGVDTLLTAVHGWNPAQPVALLTVTRTG